MMSTQTMRTVRVYRYGGPEELKLEETPCPQPQVVGTASTANLDFVRALGADSVVDYGTTVVESAVQDVDLVLDSVGGRTLLSSLAALRPGGTLISIAGPPPQEPAQERGVRAMMIRAQPSSDILQMLTPLIDAGHIKVTTGKAFPLSEVQQAHEYGQHDHGRGRIVLCMD